MTQPQPPPLVIGGDVSRRLGGQGNEPAQHDIMEPMLADRWGVTDDETRRPYACDLFLNAPALEAWRAVDIAAPPDAVWRWITQLRVAPYAYDWIDNLGRRSPRRLIDLPEPKVGDNFTSVGGRPRGRIVSLDPGRQLTGAIMGAHMSYVLDPQGQLATRLLLKVVMQATRFPSALSLGDLVMARRQLLNITHLAELDSHPAIPAS